MCEALYDINIISAGLTACSCTELFSSYRSVHNITNQVTFIRTVTVEDHVFTVEANRLTDKLDLSMTLPDECCGTRCSIDANDVRLLFWPVKSDVNSRDYALATTPSNQQGIVSNGQTLSLPLTYLNNSNSGQSISPSVYVECHGLEAHVDCHEWNSIARGKKYNTTIAYAPEALSTSRQWFGSPADMGQAPYYAATATCTAVNDTELQYHSSDSVGKDHLMLSLPSDLTLVDPSWRTCTPAFYGVFDPPRTLGTATFIASPPFSTARSSTASPGAQIGPAYAPATLTPALENDAPASASLPSDWQGSDQGQTNSPSFTSSCDKSSKKEPSAAPKIEDPVTQRDPQGLSASSDKSQDSSHPASSTPPGGAQSGELQASGGNGNEVARILSSNLKRGPKETTDDDSNSDPSNDPMFSPTNKNSPQDSVSLPPPGHQIMVASKQKLEFRSLHPTKSSPPPYRLLFMLIATITLSPLTLDHFRGQHIRLKWRMEIWGQVIVAGFGNESGRMVFTGEGSRAEEEEAWIRRLKALRLGAEV